MSQKTIFFAYEDGHAENKDAISKATQVYNTHQKTYKIVKWEDLKNSGNIIGSRIFNNIKQCDIFACDLTYLNVNVLFELGYAIACEKKLKIFLNPNIIGAKENYSDLRILRNIEYTPFSSSKEIKKELQQHIQSDSLSLRKIIPGIESINIDNDVFLINIKNKNQAAIDLEEFLMLMNDTKYIFNSEDEISYQTLIWYLNTILRSNIILLHMLGEDKNDHKFINAEYSLYAGLALGLGKKVCLIAPSPYHAPIDYSDILIKYSSVDDCLDKVEKWLGKRLYEISQNKSIKETNDIKYAEQDKKLSLLKLGIGYGVAETEELSTAENFVGIDAYYEALTRKKIIIIGRKGSGKTEIFLRLKEQFVSNKDNFIVIIKPDSDEILSNIELTNLYHNERSKRAFFVSVWKYVIFSNIFIEIIKNINALNIEETERHNIERYYEDNKEMFNNNFYGMIKYISKKFVGQNITADITLLDKINKQLHPMIKMITTYFEKKKYKKIFILADNLDAGWNPKNHLDLQSLMLVVLIEYINFLKHDIGNENIDIRGIIFLRRDIFNYIIKDTQESDKIIMESFEINWDRFPNQLKLVINNRLLAVLGNEEKIDTVWKKYFSFRYSSYPFDKILDTIIKRPRDAIYFMSKLFESAVNNNKETVDDDDYNYALEEYTKYLYNNMILELRTEFPSIEEILKEFQKQFPEILNKSTVIPIEGYYKILRNMGYDKYKDALLKKFMDESYIVGEIKGITQNIIDYKELMLKKDQRILKVFPRNRIYLIMRLVPFSE
jgi:hypothetical protein